MNGRIKRVLAVAAVGTVVGLGAGGFLFADRLTYAADPTPPLPYDGTTMPCGGAGSGGMMGGVMGGMMGIGGMLGQVTLDNVAKLTGIPSQDILTQLKQGKSLVEVAKDKATEQQLIDTVLAPHKEAMKLQVEQGYLTQEQADQMTEWMAQAAKTAVNGKYQDGTGIGPRGMHGGQGFGTGMMGGGNGGFGGMMGGRNGGFGGMMSGRGWN